MKVECNRTTEYFHEVDHNTTSDFRHLVEGKKDTSEFGKYTQVFDDKFGFINNLSVLDLLFNEGNYAMDYLREQTILVK